MLGVTVKHHMNTQYLLPAEVRHELSALEKNSC